MKPILAVIVLYRMRLTESSTWRELSQAFAAEPHLGKSIDVLIADNSPEPQAMPVDFAGTYVHDGENPGLARRYNQALKRARDGGYSWLLLFDQDTHPTPAYFNDLLRTADLLKTGAPGDAPVVALAPKLVMDGRIMSPHAPRYSGQWLTVTGESQGVLGPRLRVFNSGAMLSVRALTAIGGFPDEYWLDYLDHATFHRLQQAGGRVHVLSATLPHDLASARVDAPADPVRLLNRLRAEDRFYREHGTMNERIWHRVDLLRQIVGWGRRGAYAQAGVRLRVLLNLR